MSKTMNTIDDVTLYQSPVEEAATLDIQIRINGQPLFVHQARVSAIPFNQVWPGYQRPLDQTEIAYFANWDMATPVQVEITCRESVESVRIRPTSLGIIPQVEDKVVIFFLQRACQLTVEFNGTHRALHLFANPPLKSVPSKEEPNILFFGPGVHCPGIIRLVSNQTVYIDGEAVVYGAIEGRNVENIRIVGRGILDGSKFSRGDFSGIISLRGCHDVLIDGIIMRDPCAWTVTPSYCQDVHIRNVKLIGLWRYNADGIDFCNCQHCSLTDSFLRTFDDGVVFKGFPDRSGSGLALQPVQDILVQRCVFWCDWGRAIEFGAETVTPEISDIRCEDCDIIHTTHIALDIQNGDRALIHDVTFANIRVELDDDFTQPLMQKGVDDSYNPPVGQHYTPLLVVLEVRKNYYSKDSERGVIEQIRFRDIDVTAWQLPVSHLRGHDAQHQVQHITFSNLVINGQKIGDLDATGITCNEFVQGIEII
ncbi:MAG: glycoside hydrolase family protein [Anaerolineae bacterium]